MHVLSAVLSALHTFEVPTHISLLWLSPQLNTSLIFDEQPAALAALLSVLQLPTQSCSSELKLQAAATSLQ